MNVTCPSCETVYRVDPAKVPAGGVRARCAVCSSVFAVNPGGGGAPGGGAPGGGAAAPAVAAAQRAPAAPAGAAAPPQPPAPAPAAPRAARAPRAPLAPDTGSPGAGWARGRGPRPAHDEPAPAGESVHGAGPETEGPPARAGARVRPGGVPSREAPAGAARRHAAAAVQGRDREELAGIRRAGRGRAREGNVVLGRSVERDSRRGEQGILRLALGGPWL